MTEVEQNDPLGLVIFDCDGVLVDTEPIESQAVSALLKGLGLDIEPGEVARKVTVISDRDLWAIFESDLGRPLPGDIVERHASMLIDRYRQELSPMPGVIEVVAQLVAAGVPVCVASSGTLDKMEVTLGVTGLSRYFGANVYSADPGGQRKASPRSVLAGRLDHGAAAKQVRRHRRQPSGRECRPCRRHGGIRLLPPWRHLGPERAWRPDLPRHERASRATASGAGNMSLGASVRCTWASSQRVRFGLVLESQAVVQC